jgi:hypothetical protein
MVLIDENEEVIAQLDMIVADDRERQKQKEEDGEDNADSIAEPAGPSAGVSSPGETATHWRLAAPDRKVALALFEAQMSGKNGDTFEGFDLALRQYLLREHPGLQISSQTMIYVSFHHFYQIGVHVLKGKSRFNRSVHYTWNFNPRSTGLDNTIFFAATNLSGTAPVTIMCCTTRTQILSPLRNYLRCFDALFITVIHLT